MKPRELKQGDIFSLRPTRNSRKYKVKGIVLKICRENGFKNFHSEDHGKVLVPVENHSAGQLVLNPESEIYVRNL